MNAKQILECVNKQAAAANQPVALGYGESELENGQGVLLACSVTVPSLCSVRCEYQATQPVSVHTKRAIKRRLAGEATAELLYKLLNS